MSALDAKLAGLDAEIDRLRSLRSTAAADLQAEEKKPAPTPVYHQNYASPTHYGSLSDQKHWSLDRRDGLAARVDRFDDKIGELTKLRDTLELEGLPASHQTQTTTAKAVEAPAAGLSDEDRVFLAEVNAELAALGLSDRLLESAVTMRELYMDAISTRKVLKQAFQQRDDKIDALTKRLTDLEESFTYKGVWDPTATYIRNNSVTRDGSLWIATSDNANRRPGSEVGAQHWRLAVKAGRDAQTKDAK